MTAREIIRFPGALGWAVLCIAVALLIAFAVWKVGEAGRQRDRADEATAGRTIAEGRTEAARDASAIRDRADTRDRDINDLVQEAEHEIRTAGDRDAAHAAALRRLCQLAPAGDPRCRVLDADPRRVD